jgi:hypothetical protein
MMIEESGGTSGCSDPKYCQNGKPKSPASKPPPNKTPTKTPTRTSTPTTNPTLSSMLTNVPFSLILTPLPTSTPSPEYVLNQAPSSTPTPTATPIPNNDPFPWQYTKPSILSPGFAPNADDIWDIIGGALPLINTPATSLNQIANNTINAGINATRAIVNALSNGGSAVNEAIGNALNYGPVMPIFYIPSPYDLFPVTSQEPVYN